MSKLLLIILISFLIASCKQNLNGKNLDFNEETKTEHNVKFVFTGSEKEEEHMEQINYLRKNIFKGLKNLNDGVILKLYTIFLNLTLKPYSTE